MANILDISELTLNPKEVESVKAFIKELVLESPEFKALHQVIDGVTMKQQVVLVGQLGLAGVKSGNDCTRKSSGAVANLTEKYYNPQEIEDLFNICAKEWNGLFKPFYDKAMTIKERYDLNNATDISLLITEIVKEAVLESLYRLVWYGDTDVDEATSENAGLIDDDNIPAFSPINGYFKQIFNSTDVKYTDITDLQETENVTASEAYNTFMSVYKNADARVRANKDSIFYASGQMFLGLVEYLQNESISFTLDYTLDGFQRVKFMGHNVVDMTNVFDKYNKYFISDTTDEKPWLQHRVVFTMPSNLHVATLDENGIDNVEVWYNQDERKTKMAFGYTVDAVIVDENLVSVAY